MSQGFLIWTDFHPILVGAGCLALGYVYGRHCRSVNEIPADAAPASEDVCCAQSQSNTYFEDLERPCKCCVSAPADFDATAVGHGKTSKFTRSPFLVQDAAEGFAHAERSSKRGLAHRMEKLEHSGGEAQGMRLLASRPYSEKGYQVLEEERFLQDRTPYKKQKASLCLKGKAEMGFDPLSLERGGNEDNAATATAATPWSREMLHKRIDYFNNVSEATAETGRSEESRKLRLIKKKFVKGSSKGEPAAQNNSTTTTPNTTITTTAAGVVVRSGSTTGLVQLATLDHPADDTLVPNPNLSPNPNSPHRIAGGGCNETAVGETNSVDPALQKASEIFSFENALPICPGLDGTSQAQASDGGAFKWPSCELNRKQAREEEAVLWSVAACPVLSSMQAECSKCLVPHVQLQNIMTGGRSKSTQEGPGDEVLKAEIYELFTEADGTQVSFEEIVSLLETRLQTSLQERKALIPDLVCEVARIGKLLEKERVAMDEEVKAKQQQNNSEATATTATATAVQQKRVKCASSSSAHLGKLPFLYDCARARCCQR